MSTTDDRAAADPTVYDVEPATPSDVPPPRATTRTGNLARGLLMGTADLVPGVSGGTMALVTGIYERLVAAVRDVTALPLLLARGHVGESRERARATEWSLVLPVIGGILLAIAIGSRFIPALLEDYPAHMSALFFGLVVASIPVPWRLVEHHGWRERALVVGSAVVAFLLTGLPPDNVADPSLLQAFASATVAICAMILPGISGSYLLEALGMYHATLDALHELDLAYIATFAAGAVTGLAAFSRLLGWLLRRHHATMMAVLVGLMAGSLRALWPWVAENDAGERTRTLALPDGDVASVLGVAALAVVGAVAVTAVIHLAERSHPRDAAGGA